MAQQWFAKLGDEIRGPLSSVDLKQLAESGVLRQGSLIKLSDQSAWVQASQVRGLFAANMSRAPDVPPPLPRKVSVSETTDAAIVETSSGTLSQQSISPQIQVVPAINPAHHSIASKAVGRSGGQWKWWLGGSALMFLAGALAMYLIMGQSTNVDSDNQLTPADPVMSIAKESQASRKNPRNTPKDLSKQKSKKVAGTTKASARKDPKDVYALTARCDLLIADVWVAYITLSPTPQDMIASAVKESAKWADDPTDQGAPKNPTQAVSRCSIVYYGLSGLMLADAAVAVQPTAPKKHLSKRFVDMAFSEKHVKSFKSAEEFWSLVAMFHTFVQMCGDDNPYNRDVEKQAKTNGPQPTGAKIAAAYRRVRQNLASTVKERFDNLVIYGLKRFGHPTKKYLYPKAK